VLNRLIFIIFLSSLYLNATNINTVVSIQPLVTFVNEIAKDNAQITLMIKPGKSPHTYEPKPSQMVSIANAKLYFAIGVEFDKIWTKRFKNQNKSLKIIHLDEGIKKIHMQNHNEHDHNHQNYDPHIWLSPKNVKVIAKKIYTAFVDIDSKNKNFYKENLVKFLTKIDITDSNIKNILKNVKKGSKFMVFHPSWGYFAKEYGLVQVPVEVEGKSIKPKTLIKIIEIAKKEKIKSIIVQPEFSNKVAKMLAKELNIKVVKISPLSKEWSKNLIKLAKSVR